MRFLNILICIYGILCYEYIYSQTHTISERNLEKTIYNNELLWNKEQRKLIKELYKEEQTYMLETNDSLRKLLDQLLFLQTEESPDFNRINKTIEEIGVLYVEREKMKAKTRQKIRNLLNDDQKLVFDDHYIEQYKKKMKEKNDSISINE